jgi:hypothetical protein
MLDDEKKTPTPVPDEAADPGRPRDAMVARTRSGADHHNTLVPRWDFHFFV